MKTINSFGKILACGLYVSGETEFTNWPGFCNMSTPCLGYYKQLITQCYTILGMYLVYTDNNKGIILYVKEGSDYYKLELYSMSELKTLDTFTCQRPVFSLGVSQHMHTMTNLWKFELNWSSKLQERTPSLHYFVWFKMHNKRLQLKSFITWVRNYLFI